VPRSESNHHRRFASYDERDGVGGEHDVVADARESTGSDRQMYIDAIFAAAALRDDRAAIRDFEADQRDTAANLDAFINDVDDADAFRARLLAKADREQAKADRVAAEVDRYVLSDLSPTPEERQEALERRLGAALVRMEEANGRVDVGRRHAGQRRISRQGLPVRQHSAGS
jgi:hypothetical protein